MFPCDARCSRAAVAVTSSGASQTITPSKAPNVQYIPVTLTPIFLAVALNAAARSQVSRTALIPCSVKCMVVMNVAIAELPPGETVMCGGILFRLPGLGVSQRPAGVRSWDGGSDLQK